MKIKNGATMWSRQTIESDIFYNQPDKWFKIWFYIINRVNHKDTKQFKRAEGFFKYIWVQEYTGASKNQLYKCLNWLRKEDMINTRKTTRGIVVKVINYDLYQNLTNYKKDTDNTLRRHQGDTINKNEKNDNNDNLGGKKKNKSILIGYYENNPVFKVAGKLRIKCADNNWRDYGGETSELKPNKTY